MIPGVVEVSIEAKVAIVSVNGAVANLLTYNGFYTAPTIKVRRGDLSRVNLKNSLSMLGTNILGHEPLDVADEISALSGFETHILFLKDINLSGSNPESYTSMMDYMHGKEGNTVMVNGLVNPVWTSLIQCLHCSFRPANARTS